MVYPHTHTNYSTSYHYTGMEALSLYILITFRSFRPSGVQPTNNIMIERSSDVDVIVAGLADTIIAFSY